ATSGRRVPATGRCRYRWRGDYRGGTRRARPRSGRLGSAGVHGMVAPGAPLAGTPAREGQLTSIKPGGTMEGKGLTAEQSSSPGGNGEQSGKNGPSETHARGGELTSRS